MKIRSPLSSNKYLSAMKSHMESFTDFGVQRYTGIFIGRFFSITHHSGHEWNRRITNEKQRAIGFVAKDAEGCTVHCIRLAGYTNPISLIVLTLLYSLAFCVEEQGFDLLLKVWWMPLLCTLLTAAISAAASCWTERGEEGGRMINALLIDPVDPFSVKQY